MANCTSCPGINSEYIGLIGITLVIYTCTYKASCLPCEVSSEFISLSLPLILTSSVSSGWLRPVGSFQEWLVLQQEEKESCFHSSVQLSQFNANTDKRLPQSWYVGNCMFMFTLQNDICRSYSHFM